MKDFINITKYGNFRTEMFNKVEEFFTEFVILNLVKDIFSFSKISSTNELFIFLL